MDIDKSVVEKTFDMLDEYYSKPVQPGEITATMLYKEDPSVTQQTHLRRLKTLTVKGQMVLRIAKKGELAFRPANDGRK